MGGYAQGVLGCEATSTASSEITLVQGWNWYDGNDPTAVGAGQYDFETVIVHELGHALGLGHNPDPSSAMYATLATGTARRDMTVADLNIPDGDGGAFRGLPAAIPFQNATSRLARNNQLAEGSVGVAVLDEVLSGWARADSGSPNGIAHRVLGQGTNPAVLPLLSPQSTQPGRLVNDPQAVDVLLERVVPSGPCSRIPHCRFTRSCLGERQVKAYPRIQTDPRTVGKTNRRRVIGAFRKPLYGITFLTVHSDTPCQHSDTPCQHSEARRGPCRR